MTQGLADAAIRSGRRLRAAIYNRVSIDRRTRQRQRSVGEQDEENRQHCDDNGWIIEATFADNDRSASRFAKKDRPDWDRLLDDLCAGRFDVLVLWESSRGDRKAAEWMTLLDTCRNLGILIHVTSHDRTYDMRIPRDWKALAEDGVDSHYSSEETAVRIRRTVRSQAVIGRPHGRIRFGYRREYDPRTRELLGEGFDDEPRLGQDANRVLAILALGRLIHEMGAAMIYGLPARTLCADPIPDSTVFDTYTRAAIVKEAAKRDLAGESLYSVCRDLARRGIRTRTGRPWAAQQLKEMLLNPAYAGLRVHQGKVVGKATWPALLDEKTHYALVAKYSSPDRRPYSKDHAIKHVLSGIVMCGMCGGPVMVWKNRGYLSYMCNGTGRKAGVTRFHVSRSKARVEAYVRELVVGRLMAEDAAAVFAADEDETARLRGLLDEVATKQARLDEYYALAASGDLTPQGLAKVEKQLLAEIEEARSRTRRVRRLPVLADLIAPDIDDVAEEWDRLPIDRKREVISALFEKIEIMPVGQGNRHVSMTQSVRVTWRS